MPASRPVAIVVHIDVISRQGNGSLDANARSGKFSGVQDLLAHDLQQRCRHRERDWTDQNSNRHVPEDLPDQIDPATLERVARIVAGVVTRIQAQR
jgi:hypothetical protein